MKGRPRVVPVTSRSDVAAEHHPIVDAVEKVYGNIRGPWGMLLHSPRLAERVLPIVPFLRQESVVEGRLRSIGILAAVRELGAEYVWSAQVAAARQNRVGEEVIRLLRARGDPGKLPADEREVVLFARQLARSHRVDRKVFDALRKRHGVPWLVELTACAGYFGLVSGIANAFQIPVPDGGDQLKAKVGSRKSKVKAKVKARRGRRRSKRVSRR